MILRGYLVGHPRSSPSVRPCRGCSVFHTKTSHNRSDIRTGILLGSKVHRTSDMRSSLLLVVAVLPGSAVPAHAETSAIPPEPSSSTTSSVAPHDAVPETRPSVAPKQRTQTLEANEFPIGFSLNTPLAWLLIFDHAASVGASAYMGLTHHQAVRANAAWYACQEPLLLASITGYAPRGRMIDAGIDWVWYPRRLWDGFMVEAGVIYRDRDLRIGSDSDEGDTIEETSTYAARAMVGWSWLVTRHSFFEIAAGVSAGYGSGHATPPAPETTYKISGREIVPEGHVHIGLAFGR